jgi:hypothetical protein
MDEVRFDFSVGIDAFGIFVAAHGWSQPQANANA